MEQADLCDVIARTPGILSGAPVFRGTRAPVSALLDHLQAGDGMDVFLRSFPTVSREQAVAHLTLAHRAVLSRLDETAA